MRMPATSMRGAVACAALLGLLGCGSSSDSSSVITGPSPTVVTETFSGSLDQNGTALHTFTVANSGYSLLAGFTSVAPSSITSLGIGIGSWDSTTSTCGLNLTQNDAAKNGSTALSGTAGSGSFCIRVYDGGNIPAGTSASYTVQVQHY